MYVQQQTITTTSHTSLGHTTTLPLLLSRLLLFNCHLPGQFHLAPPPPPPPPLYGVDSTQPAVNATTRTVVSPMPLPLHHWATLTNGLVSSTNELITKRHHSSQTGSPASIIDISSQEYQAATN